MKINSGNSPMLFPGNDNVSANIDDNSIISENKSELLATSLNTQLSFDGHINNFCITISFSRVSPYMCFKGKQL